MRRFLLPISLLFFAAAACKKADEGFTHALVINTGDITSAGCGYLLRLQNGTLLKPDQLLSAYQHDSLGVLVKYSETGRTSNCQKNNPIDIVSVDEIKMDL